MGLHPPIEAAFCLQRSGWDVQVSDQRSCCTEVAGWQRLQALKVIGAARKDITPALCLQAA